MEHLRWWETPHEEGPEQQTDTTEQAESPEKQAEKRTKGGKLRGLLEIIKGEKSAKHTESGEQQKPKESLIDRARRSSRNLLLLMRGAEKQAAQQETMPDLTQLTAANDALEVALRQGEPVDQRLADRLETLRSATLRHETDIAPEVIAATVAAIDELSPQGATVSAETDTTDFATEGYGAPTQTDEEVSRTRPAPTTTAHINTATPTPIPKRVLYRRSPVATTTAAAIAGGVAAATTYAVLRNREDVSRAAAAVRQETTIQQHITDMQTAYVARPMIRPETLTTQQLIVEQNEIKRLSQTMHAESANWQVEDHAPLMRQQLIRRLARSEGVGSLDAAHIADRLLQRHTVGEIMAWSESKLQRVTNEAIRDQAAKTAAIRTDFEKPNAQSPHNTPEHQKVQPHRQRAQQRTSGPVRDSTQRNVVKIVIAIAAALLVVGLLF